MALRFDQLGFTDGICRGERSACDRSCEIANGVGPFAITDEARSGGGPCLPAQVLLLHRIAEADIAAGNQDVGGFELRDGRRSGGGGSDRPASRAAMPPATTARTRTMIRAGFIPAIPTITLLPELVASATDAATEGWSRVPDFSS
jgi:hypothetical protein